MRIIFSLCLLSLSMSVSLAGTPTFIGGQQCSQCHPQQTRDWQGSHHDLAMQEANPQTVLGDFNDAEIEQFGVRSRFFRRGDSYMVRTDGPDGELQDYPISYTFGVSPLQQYLIKFPGGRLQALDIAWDTRPRAQGGQRWFYLHGDERIGHDDVLHWTGPNLNWNYMCADCHSTNLRKHYDAASDSYATSWSAMDVSCEACHGPGSAHREWAQSGGDAAGAGAVKNKGLSVSLNERDGVRWSADPQSGLPQRSEPRTSSNEIQVCARCHSRRSQLSDAHQAGQPFLDGFHPALLTEGLYHPNGLMQDEVYVWGSFLQSRMAQAGVTCSDCHNPHSGALRLPGDQVCSQCHSAERYASSEHHHHPAASDGARCTGCHMPETTFMGVDQRNDHSFRIPRPDESGDSSNTPNACNQCHSDQTPQWASAQLRGWFGHRPQGLQQYGSTLRDARQQLPLARTPLLKLIADPQQPAIARATALSALSPYLSAGLDQSSLMLLQAKLDADDPLERLGALAAVEALQPQQRVLAAPLLWDDLLAIRIEAARLLAVLPAGQLGKAHQQVLDRVMQEYIDVQQFNADRPESHFNLGGLYADLGRFADAESEYRKAAQMQPRFVPSYVNLAQMFSDRGRETEAAGWLREGIAQVADSAALHHALGLSLIRQQDSAAAVQSLQRAAELGPEVARYAYVYAVALQSAGDVDAALTVLRQARSRHPGNADILFALLTFNRDAGRLDAARAYGQQLMELVPGNPAIAGLVKALGPGKPLGPRR
jgi:predicted CXXCH cytochrome family protein